MRALEEYERRTANRRSPSESQLLIAMIRPYKAVSSSTVARWLKAMLANSGIDVSIFKAHSVRGAATSAAANAGITTNDILNAADWSSQSIFHKFYYRPVHNSTFGKTVLAGQLSTTEGQLQSHVDMETEHSEI